MLCSEREMGLSDEHNGIIDLPEDAPVGVPFASVMGLDDPLIDISLTPDRADCAGVRGIARDLSAAGLGPLKTIDTTPVPGEFASPVTVTLDFPEGESRSLPDVRRASDPGRQERSQPALASGPAARRSACGRSRRWSISPI